MVQCRADDHHGFTAGLIRIVGKLPGHPNNFLTGYAGDFFLPRGGVGHRLVVVIGGYIVAPEAAIDGVVGHGQVIDGGNLGSIATGQAQ